jgi:sulfate transport system substrate-binding protein
MLKAIWQNVRLIGSSAGATLNLFELGAGDALLTYEQDALLAQQRGIPLKIIIPERTILARHFAVTMDENITFDERPVVQAFQSFLLSAAGQQILSQYYFQPAIREEDAPPTIAYSYTENEFGGWLEAYQSIIEDCWKNEIMSAFELEPMASFLVRGGN